MNAIEKIRAWKDPAYRANLSAAEQAQHPAGMIELTGTALEMVSGGGKSACGKGRGKSGKSGKSSKSSKSHKSSKSRKSSRSGGSSGGRCW